ncbi:MAG: hypothetical protein R2764_01825 [Bacteroidales bacterium]
MKKLIYIFALLLIILACEKEREEVAVKYRVSKAYSDTEITYRDKDAILETEVIQFESVEDIWEYSYSGKRGDIIYISTVYHDSSSSVNVEILLDGKTFKKGSSSNEPDKYVTVSGTIPY